MSCAVCGADAARPKLRVADAWIRECGACGLAWWEPEPGFDPARLYDAGYFADTASARGYDDYAGLEASLRSTFARRLRRLGAPPPGARLLDLGAAFGFAVAEAQRAGWHAVGSEISRAAAARARDATAGRIARADAARAPFADACFDAVTLWDVLEHLPDPHATLAEIARVLRPGGQLALSTGDVGSLVARLSGARWHLYTLPEHLFFFSRPSLRLLLERHGFHIRSLRAEGAVYTLGYLVERLRKTLLGGRGPGAGRWPGRDLRVPLNLFDVVTVHAALEVPG